jgi:hypothetical protein
MATAQRMVMEAAKLAMPNTKVVNEDGNPKVVYHGGQFGISSFIPKRNMHFGTKKAAMQRILDEQWGYDNWLMQNEDGSYSWKYEDEYDEANNVQSNKTFATEEEAMEDALLYFGNEVVVKPYFLNIRNIERTDDAQSSWDDAIEVVKAESDNVDGIVYENWYEDKGSDSYIAFSPNQIKSADPVTYDDAGNVIPLSERFNPKKEDIRYSLRTMSDGVDMLRDIANKYNIGVPMMLVENASEYVAMMREWGVKNAEKKAKAFATYLADEMLICFNGTHFLDADAEFIEDAALHEYAHHATAQAWEEVITLVATMNRADILWVRDNMLTEHYNDIPAENTINEIISTFVETMDAKARTAAIKGEMEISKIVETLHEEISNDTEIDDKGKGVLISTLPLVAKALEFIKEKYNGERETIIVLRRDAEVRDNGSKLAEESGERSQEPTMAMRDGNGRDREYSQSDRNARETAEVETRYSMPSGKGVDLDMPFIDEEGNVVETMPVRRARNVYAQMEERIERNHQTNLRKIAKDAEEARKVAGKRYREEKAKRRATVQGMRGNAAKVAYILGDNAVETLPYEVQAMVMIANGLKVRWEDSTTLSGAVRRGLGSELGLRASKGDRRSTT